MSALQIAPEQKLRVASLNLSSSTAFYRDRVKAVVSEAEKRNVDVLLLQEISSPDALNTLAFKAGYKHVFISPTATVRRNGEKGSSTGILSRYPLSNENELSLTGFPGATRAAYANVEFNGHHIYTVSAQLLSGAENGFIRLKQAILIEEEAARVTGDRENAILGGTFNDIPEGDSVRYLKGLKATANIKSSFWIDVTENSDIETTVTTRYHSLLGKEAAEQRGIPFPDLLPERKIDYLFCRGWVYGNIGMPMDPQLFGVSKSKDGLTVSDHYGVMADFWFPEKKSR